MDENVVGFLLGVFMSLFGLMTILASLGLVIFTIRKVQKRGSGLKIILYAIETVIPFSIVGALAWLASNTPYNPVALWAGVFLMGAINALILFHKTPQGSSLIIVLRNSIWAELVGGNVGDGPKMN